jgi:large subunit ribosomal protein L25
VAEFRMSAEPRTQFGKGGARRTRRAGLVPAVLYGHGTDPRHLSLPAREFSHALKTGAGANVLLALDVDGTRELALPKAVQRDPIRGDVEHVDLLLVRRGEQVTVEIAITVTGQPLPDTLVDLQMTTLSVHAEATAIPQHLEIDISGLPVGASVRAADVELPAGVVLNSEPEAVVVHVLPAPTAAQVDAELAGAEAELAGPSGFTPAPAGEDAEPAGAGDRSSDAASGEGGPGGGHSS